MTKETILDKVVEGFYLSATNNNLIQIYQEEFKFFAFTLKNNKDLQAFLKSPFIDVAKKDEVIDNSFKDIFINEIILCIKLIVNRELINNIDYIVDRFNFLANEHLNIIEGIIYTPFNLSKDQHKILEEKFSKIYNKKVILDEKIESSLICGIRVMINEDIYEYSINSSLENIKNSLKNKVINGETTNG